MRNPIRVNVKTTFAGTSKTITDFAQKTPSSLSIFGRILPVNQKLNHLVAFLRSHTADKIIVYGLTCACIDYWFYVLRTMEILKGITIRALHGRMQQNGREKAIQAFRLDVSGSLIPLPL